MNFTIDLEQENDGRWTAEVLALPEAIARVPALVVRVLVNQLEHGKRKGLNRL